MVDEREILEFDFLIIGAGISGLSAAIRLAQLNQVHKKDFSICVIEKASHIGGHSLSGAVFEPRALNELIPNWYEKGAPLKSPVKNDRFYYLTQKSAVPLPKLKTLKNQGNFIISLGELCRWLSQEAEALGVNIFPGFSAAEILYEGDRVIGVQTSDHGLEKENKPTEQFQPGIRLIAKQTLFAEGCRGSLSQCLIEKYHLNAQSCVQTYGIGLKEVWEVPPELHNPGLVIHSVGWPLDRKIYGGSFLYHYAENKVSVGFVVGLDYENPFLDPFKIFQMFKTHPKIKNLFEAGVCIEYGARALNEGGWQSIPRLSFPGGLLIGDSAGFLNVAKIKGNHTAMKSGMLAAEAIFSDFSRIDQEVTSYESMIKNSWVNKELKKVRNIRPAFNKGLWFGLMYSAVDQVVFRGVAPWTFSIKTPDHARLQPANKYRPIDYPKPDNIVTFDRLTQLALSGTRHHEQQPCHIKLKNLAIPIDVNLKVYDAPEQRYCPANVYEILYTNGVARLQINFANCLHCKTCDIKDPKQNIVWTVPEGGDGPNYTNM